LLSTSTDLTCRRLAPSDSAQLSGIYEQTDGPSLTFLLELTRKPAGTAWCVVSSNRLIAVIWLNVLGDEAEIIDFRVDTSLRQQGVGRFLLRETLKTLNVSGVKSVFLEVRGSNVAAITLYEHAGFATIGRREDYYPTSQGREDALVMRHDSTKR
jgi:ribosomal-protein-alanine N-acetyltransferase